jgi:simple sugar transport system ATP-binding protein
MLGFHDEKVYGSGLLFNRGDIIADEAAKMESYDIRPRAPLLKTANFSGGNQQKIVLAREIDRNPKVILIGQPTRGVDIGAIEFIHKRLVELRDAGKAILVVSVEMEEILGLADRILVMAGGEIVGEVSAAEATEERIGLLMAGVRSEAKA